MKTKVKLKSLLFLLLCIGGKSAFAQLPQDHSYQIVLRDYLGTLSASDFELDLDPLLMEDSYFSSDDDIFQSWLVWGYDSSLFPSTRGIRVGPEHFTLDNIESGGRVYMQIGRGGWLSSEQTAFFADWEYPGNPHYNSRAVKLRAFVAAAVDMMMMDRAHDEGDGIRSDFLGGQMIMWAYPYGVAKDVLPQEIRDAFETGLVRMFEKLEDWGPQGTHADMDTRATVGMLYSANYVESQDLTQRAHAYIDRLLDRHLKGPGYIDHGDAWDGSYNGISLYHLAWAALLTDYAPLHEAVNRMSKLKAYVTLPDPDGNWISPSHSNVSSPGYAASDQWGPFFREVGLAGLSDHALYTLEDEIRGTSSMMSDLERRLRQYINATDRGQLFTSSSSDSPGEWERRHWTATNFNYASHYYKEGLYNRITTAPERLRVPPFARDEKFVESFDDKFLSARENSYGVILFNDRLSWWTREGDTEELNGFGGGNLSAYWTPSTGTILLGVGRGTRNGGHDLVDWQTWPVHALSGETTEGNEFSSALQRHPEGVYDLDSEVVTATMSGDLANSYSDPRGGLQGAVAYKRLFSLEDDGVRVVTSVDADGSNSVSQLYEILPVYRQNSTSIDFEVNGSWQPAGTSEVTATRIRLQRFDGEVFIEFAQPARVKLSAEEFYLNPDSQSGAQIRNIMINLLEGGSAGLANQSVEYKIASYEGEAVDWDPGDDDNGFGGDDNENGGSEGEDNDSDSDDNGDGDDDIDESEDESGDDDISDEVIISEPTHGNPELIKQIEYLETTPVNVTSANGKDIYLNYDWRISEVSMSLFNLSFDIDPSSSSSDTLRDYSTYENHGLLGSGDQAPAWMEGRFGGAYQFDGVNDHIVIPSDEALEAFDEFTIEAWIKHDGWGDDWATIISKPFYEAEWADPWVVFNIARYGSEDQLQFQITVNEDEFAVIQTSSKIPADQWVHVAGTYDGSEMKLHIDGELDNSVSVDAPLVQNRNTNIYLGGNWSRSESRASFRGLIDEVRLHARALTDRQLKNHYAGNYHMLRLEETGDGEQWTAAVTPNQSMRDGETKLSEPIIISNEVANNEPMGGEEEFKTSLSQNYPNPFTSTTNIPFQLDENQQVALRVYDTTGRLVMTLHEGEAEAGAHVEPFNPVNLASGVYLYRLETENDVLIRKMIFLR